VRSLEEYCKEQPEEELHDMIRHVREKPRWERTDASYVMLQAAIKELIRRKLIVQTG
tara:strand:- start:817 stop:987 length:171 start_codon:yes stop_codon:yes gene_type:complete